MATNAVITERAVPVFGDPGLRQPLGFELQPETEVEIGNSNGSDGASVPVTLPNGARGFISGQAKARWFQRTFLSQDEGVAYQLCSPVSPVVSRFRKGDEFWILRVVPDNKEWIQVRSVNGNLGYMDAKVRILSVDVLRKNVAQAIAKGQNRLGLVKSLCELGISNQAAQELVAEMNQAVQEYKESPDMRRQIASKYARHMVYGVLWAAGGTIATVVGYSAASSSPRGGTYMIFWGAILFGIVDFFRGLFGYLKYS